ncbi:NADAR family protein, partial [Pseudoalteromonas distincta]|uniref:NADAR family protein n=1 Tax=Pseudoalteromonas distincta TaxID=77608 RepID=UPI0034E8B754
AVENAVVIKFYSIRDKEYGCFSNFAAAPFELDGKYWPTTEHYYQAQKFLDPTLQKQVRQTKKPGDAARLGRDRKLP